MNKQHIKHMTGLRTNENMTHIAKEQHDIITRWSKGVT